MSYKTLLALQSIDEPVSCLQPVAELARHFKAHVDALVLDLVAPMPAMTAIQDPAYAWNVDFPEQLKAIERHANSVREYLEEQGVEAIANGEAQQSGLIGMAVARAALATDLVVLPAPAAPGSLVDGLMRHALEGALFDAGKPVLVLGKDSPTPPNEPADVIVAWDGGREAAHAVQAALPLLKAAARVALFIVEKSGEFELDERAQLLRRHLRRHGVETDIDRVDPAGRSIARAFAEHVTTRQPDLLVMGAYGHSRLRERLFAGVTRTALREFQMSLLLAH